MLTIETRELLAAPQWQDSEWHMLLHRRIVEEIAARSMYRPWLESFATVTDLAADDEFERWLHEDVQGRTVHWLAPGRAIEVVDSLEQRVFEPPAQVFSFYGQVPESQVADAPEPELDGLIDLAAEAIDGKFRRLAVFRDLGEVRVGLWSGIQSKMWTDAEGVLNLRGKYIVAAMAVRDAAAVPEPAAETPAESDSIEAERAALTAHLEEHAAQAEPVVDEASAPVAEEEPVRQKYDEPAGDLREVAEDEVVGSEDFSGVRRVPS